MAPENAGRTARERARAELTREIKAEARRQLAVSGADGLSLRAVSRALGMASSALYRYFASRDDLLTALIIDAYDAIGAEVEKAVAAAPPASSPGGARTRWLAACRAVRSWARANPHEYALLYGSPVPGYRAPEETIPPAARVPAALISIMRDAAAAGLLTAPPEPGAPPEEGALPEGLAAQAEVARAAIGSDVPLGVLARGVIAWTQLFGMVSFELFGQFANTFDPADHLFDYAAARMAAFIGLPQALPGGGAAGGLVGPDLAVHADRLLRRAAGTLGFRAVPVGESRGRHPRVE